MKALLDTHTILWWLDDAGKLSVEARNIIADGSNEIFVSVASIWEIVVKQSLGKLDVPDDLLQVIEQEQFDILPIRAEHAIALRELPPHHRDPFDRMLIAQSIHEQCVFVSRDECAQLYDVKLIRS